jgi:hypothetical protein
MSLFDKIKAWFGAKPAANDTTTESEQPDDGGPKQPKTPAAEADTPRESASVEADDEPREKGQSTPKEDARLEAEGRALFDAGDPAAAISFLSKHGILFARHEPTTLPCLCKRCLRPDVSTAESGRVRYVRDFVVTKHRVFFYWTPAELGDDAKQVRASMRSELRHRLRVLATKEEETRQGMNPFTKQPITILPKHERRRRINPFTGKPIP